MLVLKGRPPQDVWHVSAGPQATAWRRLQACGGLFVCVMLAWHTVPLHLFPISGAESIKQGADRGREHSSSWLDHGLYYVAVCALPAGELAAAHPRLLGSVPCQQTDGGRTGRRLTGTNTAVIGISHLCFCGATRLSAIYLNVDLNLWPELNCIYQHFIQQGNLRRSEKWDTSLMLHCYTSYIIIRIFTIIHFFSFAQ